MRGRSSTIAVIMIAVASVSWYPGPAAATGNTTVVSRQGLPAGMDVADGCAANAASYVHIVGPATPPLGSGSLQLSSTVYSYFDFPVDAQPASDLTAASLDVNTAGGVLYDITLNKTVNGGDDLTLSVPGNSTWQSTDLMTATLGSTTTVGDTTTTNPDTTYADYLAAHSGVQINSITGFYDTDACNTSNSLARVDIDDMVVGLSGVTTTYDFEPDSSSKVSVSAPQQTAYAADTQITGVLTEAGQGISGESVDLMARPKGSGSYQVVRSVVSDYDGQVEATYRPRADTQFYWSFDGDEGVGQVSSPVATVNLGSTISLHSFERTLTKGQDLDLFGSVTPVVAGRTITVYDRKGKHTVKLGRTSLAADGLYGIAVAPPKGKSAVYAKVGASGKTPGATSNTMKVTQH